MLAKVLGYKYMAIEAYRFKDSEIPYTITHSHYNCHKLIESAIMKHGNFIITAVKGAFSDEICSKFDLAVYLDAPIELRLKRIGNRVVEKHKERVAVGGDMYDQHLKFMSFVKCRSKLSVDQWCETLDCPVLHLSGEATISSNIEKIISHLIEVNLIDEKSG